MGDPARAGSPAALALRASTVSPMKMGSYKNKDEAPGSRYGHRLRMAAMPCAPWPRATGRSSTVSPPMA